MPPPPKPWDVNPSGTAAAIATRTTAATNATALPTPPIATGTDVACAGAGIGAAGVGAMAPGYSRFGSGLTGGYGSGLTGGYGSSAYGSGYGGYGGSSYGLGGGYGSSYGGYGGLGGYGMGMSGGYGMGMGMGGMMGAGYQPSEFEQRGHMAFMLLGRVVELFGMFANVIQMVFSSVLQFMGSYVGLTQQYKQITSTEGDAAQRIGPNGEVLPPQEQSLAVRRRKVPESTWSVVLRNLRRAALLALLFYVARRIYNSYFAVGTVAKAISQGSYPPFGPFVAQDNALSQHFPQA